MWTYGKSGDATFRESQKKRFFLRFERIFLIKLWTYGKSGGATFGKGQKKCFFVSDTCDEHSERARDLCDDAKPPAHADCCPTRVKVAEAHGGESAEHPELEEGAASSKRKKGKTSELARQMHEKNCVRKKRRKCVRCAVPPPPSPQVKIGETGREGAWR